MNWSLFFGVAGGFSLFAALIITCAMAVLADAGRTIGRYQDAFWWAFGAGALFAAIAAGLS